MSTQRARRSIVRRRAPAPSVTAYQRSRAATVLFVFVLVFGGAWVLNGTFTAEQVEHLGGSTSSGWAIHLTMSVIEVAPVILAPFFRDVPRWLVVVLWLLSLPFGIFDVYSSAVAIASLLGGMGIAGLLQSALSTILGEVLAFLPEPMLLWLVVLIHRTLRG